MRSMIPDGDCLCNRPSGVMFIEILGQSVGLTGAEDLFRHWRITDRGPLELSDKEILNGLPEKNYVSEATESGYTEAVRTCYAGWLKRDRKGSQNAES